MAEDAATPDAAPTGLVTFLFSDIQGSTRLWEDHPAAMQPALARHDALTGAAIGASGGHIFKTGGDAFCAAFGRPEAALRAALTIQIALQAEPWGLPDGQTLRVRLALHTGEAERRGGDYFGGALGRTARLLGAAHGGQTLVSESAAALLAAALPEGASLRSLGRHRLKDLSHPQEIFALHHPDLPGDFPPLRSLESFRHNLPGQLTSFVGREAEMAQARECLRSARLVTLAGTGGAGKSRLAIQAAADALGDFPDGAWLVELAPLRDPDLVAQAVAVVLGLGEEPDKRLRETLTDALRAKSLLLVLDNCEHLVDACARLADGLLRACPGLRILATSRESLGVPGEAVLPLSPLALPPGPPLPPAADLPARFPSVRLFVDRATAASPAFRLTDGNAPSVVHICAGLDGLPLALELAAARVKVLSPEQIVRRLDDRFRLLAGGSRTALPRQQTLRALIDWSYDLLPPAEQTLFRRLSVFSGGWSLEAGEAVCAGDGVEEWEVLDLLAPLVAKSLVLAEPPEDGQVRYRLLESLRQYGRERLEAAGEFETLAERHRAWFLGWAEEAEPHLTGPEQAAWLRRLARDHDNLRLALGVCRSGGRDADGLRLAGALYHFWLARGFFREGLDWFEAALSCAPDAPPPVRAKALTGAGVLAWSQGDNDRAQAFHERGLAAYRESGDRRGIARALANLGIVAGHREDYATARRLFEDSLALYRELDSPQDVAVLLNNLGGVASDQGDLETAARLFEESLSVFRARRDVRGITHTLSNLGEAAFKRQQLGDAEAAYTECLSLALELGNKSRAAFSLMALGAVAGANGYHARTARLLGAAEALWQTLGVPMMPGNDAVYDECIAEARTALGEGQWEAFRGEGASLTPEQVAALAHSNALLDQMPS